MATKQTTKKTTTKKDVVENKPVENKEVVEEVKKVEPAKKEKTFDPTDLVNCTSVTAGELIMIGKKSGNLYRWTDCGDTQEVEYQDLKSEKLNKCLNIFMLPCLSLTMKMLSNRLILRELKMFIIIC